MTIPNGAVLGTYKVLSAIGAGGMGEVYQAHDSKLGRDVAIKVLPEQFARDPERLARFQREAKMLAALNHPNVAAIYGLEQSGNTHYLVMELVEGATLAERIRGGPIPVDEALPIARQVADAVEYAHDKNVIHRDLKPANIKVTSEGTVKVLDFGLAKAMLEEPTEADIGNSPTLSMAATRQGVILGTAAYMSPEQAKGKAVDRRADVWAYGVVLYEVLTGKQPFKGDSIAETLAAVMKEELALDKLPSNTPPALRALLRRCLDRNLRRRLVHIGEARVLLEDVLSGVSASEATPTPWIQRQHQFGWIAAAGLLFALAAVSFAHFREAPPAPASEMRTEIVTPSTTDPVSFALSPDGRQIVFVASEGGASRLWLRRLDATSVQPLAGTEGASFPFWSPDSRSVGFFVGGKLMRMDIAGGASQALADDAANRGGTWSADGTILFTRTTSSPLSRISASGGEAVEVTKLGATNSHRFPQFLPGGRQFLFYAQGPQERAGIYLGSLDSPETKRLTASDTAGLYSTSGWLLFMRTGTLRAQRLDLGRGELTGDPVTVVDPVTSDGSAFAGGVSVSDTGLVAYRSGGAGQRQLLWFDRSGKRLGAMGEADASGLSTVSLSPDGRRAAVYRVVQGNPDVWIVDATRTTRFTFDANFDRFAVWSRDGNRIIFESIRKGRRDLYLKQASGADSEELLLESAQDKIPSDWSHDGRFFAYHMLDPQAGPDIWILPMEGERKPFVFLKTNFDERRAQFSPDGRWVAYISNESGRYEIYVRAFNGNSSGSSAGGQWQVSTAGGLGPRWRIDGRELYYVAPDGKLMAAPIAASGGTITPGTPVTLFQTRMYGGGTDTNVGIQYDVSADGRFLINTLLQDDASPITLLQNWNPENK